MGLLIQPENKLNTFDTVGTFLISKRCFFLALDTFYLVRGWLKASIWNSFRLPSSGGGDFFFFFLSAHKGRASEQQEKEHEQLLVVWAAYFWRIACVTAAAHLCWLKDTKLSQVPCEILKKELYRTPVKTLRLFCRCDQFYKRFVVFCSSQGHETSALLILEKISDRNLINCTNAALQTYVVCKCWTRLSSDWMHIWTVFFLQAAARSSQDGANRGGPGAAGKRSQRFGGGWERSASVSVISPTATAMC